MHHNSTLNLKFDLNNLSRFLVKAKRATYAGNGPEKKSIRQGFKELEYSNGQWNYFDSYESQNSFHGQEVVEFKGVPVWSMSYSGGMLPEFTEDRLTTKRTYHFLKQALSKVLSDQPFRGPSIYVTKNFSYRCTDDLDVKNFSGVEEISLKDDFLREILERKNSDDETIKSYLVYSLNFNGGLIIPKT